MEEVRPGLWTWTAPQSEWDEQPAVRSYAVERDGVLVLIDPMSPPKDLVEGREVQVALTCQWHCRSAPLEHSAAHWPNRLRRRKPSALG